MSRFLDSSRMLKIELYNKSPPRQSANFPFGLFPIVNSQKHPRRRPIGHGLRPAPQAPLRRLRPRPADLLPSPLLHLLFPSWDRIIHAAGCLSRWSPLPRFSPDSDDADSFRLKPFACDLIDPKTGAKRLVLSLSSPNGSIGSPEAPAIAIAERFLPELLAAVERAKATMHDDPKELAKLILVARVGKVLFEPSVGSPVSLDSLREAAKAGEEGSKSPVHKRFYCNVPRECFEDMEQSAVQLMGLEFDSLKEHYTVKISDKQQSDSAMSCKCTVQKDGKLVIHKVELNQIRQLVEDISCLSKDLDLRLMLSIKRILKTLDPEVENAIQSIVSSAILDPDVKGGLRWPLGKESVGQRFSIVGVWHTKYKVFKNETVRLFLRHADRSGDRSSAGEVSDEVTFKLTGRQSRDGHSEGHAGICCADDLGRCFAQQRWRTELGYAVGRRHVYCIVWLLIRCHGLTSICNECLFVAPLYISIHFALL